MQFVASGVVAEPHPSHATFRFYSDLVELLTVSDETGTVVRTFAESPSVKDQIEACGIPHTEVDLILANGAAVDFAYRLRDGDRISVYPRFFAFDITVASLVRPDPLDSWRFLVDVNLGRLARYLRLLGFDTLSNGTWDDPELVRIAGEQSRMLLTRDRPLLKRAAVTHGYLVRSSAPVEQLQEVVDRFDLTDSVQPFARCMACNGVVVPADKRDVDHLLEPLTRKYFGEFRQCDRCGRVFWKGSHHARLLALVETVAPGAAAVG